MFEHLVELHNRLRYCMGSISAQDQGSTRLWSKVRNWPFTANRGQLWPRFLSRGHCIYKVVNFGQPELPAAKNFQVLRGNFDVCKEFVTKQNSLKLLYGFRTFYKHPQGPEYWLNSTVCIIFKMRAMRN